MAYFVYLAPRHKVVWDTDAVESHTLRVVAAESGADAQWSFLCVFEFHDFSVLEYRRYLGCLHFSDGNLPCLGDVQRPLVEDDRDR